MDITCDYTFDNWTWPDGNRQVPTYTNILGKDIGISQTCFILAMFVSSSRLYKIWSSWEGGHMILKRVSLHRLWSDGAKTDANGWKRTPNTDSCNSRHTKSTNHEGIVIDVIRVVTELSPNISGKDERRRKLEAQVEDLRAPEYVSKEWNNVQ